MKSIATGVLPVAFSVFRVTFGKMSSLAERFDPINQAVQRDCEKIKQKEVFKMNGITQKRVYKITLSAIFVALATALSLIKIFKMPLGGSVTLLSMLPIVMLSVMLGVKWGLGAAFVYSLLQLFLGIALDGLLGWGLTPVMLAGTILFDYILAFTCLGIAGVFRKKGALGISAGVALSLFIRFISHFISGYVIFKNLEQFEIFGSIFTNRPVLYSISYNAFYMLPEIVITTVAAALIFSAPQIKKLINN